MRILRFPVIINEIAESHILKDCSLVIDAQNFFYDFYRDSKLPFAYGAECDEYAKYIKDYLSMFKTANVECYFIFKGGTKDLKKKISKVTDPSDSQSNLIDPIFMIDIHVQVLKEMEFHYTFSEYESKADCMTLARQLKCPVLSNDIEFPLSGVSYISKRSLIFDKDQILRCELFSPHIFHQKYNVDENKIALFILLTDINIFPESSFNNVFEIWGIAITPVSKFRNKNLLEHLSKHSEEDILKVIRDNTEIDVELISEKLFDIKKAVKGEVNSEVATDYFFNTHKITDCFISGVAANHIAKEYVDLYRSKVLFKKLYETADYMELSLNIIKYAYDLLTDFKDDCLQFKWFYCDWKLEQSLVETEITKTIRRPSRLAEQTIFESGWDNIVSLDLFQHFISEIIHFDCDKLERVPDDAKMLMVTLVYIFHTSKLQPNISTFTTQMSYAVLLSYVMLGVVKERLDDDRDNNSVTTSDCGSALRSLQSYFHVTKGSTGINENLRTSLKQFEFCLSEMNYLNKLCGSPFQPTSYRKTYNGTFVYNVVYTMQNEGVLETVNKSLRSAPTVLRYFHNVVEHYKHLLRSD